MFQPPEIPKSKTAIVRKYLPEIEFAIQQGASYADLLAQLKQRGIDMSYTTFCSAISRVRAEKSSLCAPQETAPRRQKDRLDEASEAEKTLVPPPPPPVSGAGIHAKFNWAGDRDALYEQFKQDDARKKNSHDA